MNVRTALIVAGVVRAALALAAGPAAFPSGDTAVYAGPARSILESGTYGEILVPPGYSIFLIPGLLLGHGVTIALQIALAVFSTWLVYRIAFPMTARAPWCALAYALEPISILYTVKLTTETLFTTLLLTSLWLLLEHRRAGDRGRLVGAAVALAAAVYVRPIAYFLPFVLTIFVATWRPRLRALIFFVCSMSLTALWQGRNALTTGYTGFAAISDLNLYYYNAAEVMAHKRGVPFAQQQLDMGYLQEGPDPARFVQMRAEALKILGVHPGSALAFHLRGVVRTLLDPGGIEFLRLWGMYPEHGGLLRAASDRGMFAPILEQRPAVLWSMIVSGVVLATLLGLAALGAWRLGRAAALPIAAALYLLLLSGGPAGYHRFRVPVMPIVCLLAGSATFRRVDPVHPPATVHPAQ